MVSRVETTPLALPAAGVSLPTRARAARMLGGAVFCVLLSLVPLTAVPYGTVDEWWQSLFQCAVLASAALWAVEGLLGGVWLVREHRMLAPLVPLLIFVFCQSVPFGVAELAGVEARRTVSASSFETRLVAFRFIALLLFAAMLLRYTSSRRRLVTLVCVVTGVGVSSALFGIVRQATHHEGDGFLLSGLRPQLGYAQFINNNHFALLMEMCLGPLLGLLAGARGRGGRVFLCLAGATLVWSALVLSNSRGGILAMLGQVTLFALTYRAARGARGERGDGTRTGRRATFRVAARCCMVACLLFAVGVGVFWVGGEQLMGRVEKLGGEVDGGGASERAYPRRARMWQATWEMFKERPLVGSGFGGYWMAIDRHYDASGVSSPQQAHNEYLELIASGGVVCVAPVALFAFLFIRRARECLRARAGFRRAACRGALLGLCAVALHSLVDFGLHITVNAVVFAALVVIAAAHIDRGPQESGDGETEPRPLTAGRSARMRAARALTAVVFILACVVAARETARAGLSRWYSLSREREYSLASSEEAIRLSPADPVAHLYRSNMLSAAGEDAKALEELERAAAFAPEDHSLWMQLGFAREAAGESDAVAAFEQAVRLAPFYAHPRWQFGVALFRAGRPEQAFAELARAAESDNSLLPQALELLWVGLDEDARAMERALPPHSTAAQLAFVRFYIDHGKTKEAVALLRLAGDAADAERRTLTATLFAQKRFTEAYEVWTSGGRRGTVAGDGLAAVTDGSFEGDIDPTEPGFGWRITKQDWHVSAALDTKEPRHGARSLLLNFRGDSPARSPLVSQLILVEANTRYRLSFAARTQELMTTGLPSIELTDAGTAQQLSTPTLLPRGDSAWKGYDVEFVTGRATSAVSLTVQRRECPLQPCLALGRVWLDDFSLRKLF